MSYLVVNPEDRFSCDMAQMYMSRALLLSRGLTSHSTAIVMLRRSVNLTTLFLGKLRPKQ